MTLTHETADHSEHELVVVSGASTGIGAATARQLASMGFHVLAGVRTPVMPTRSAPAASNR